MNKEALINLRLDVDALRVRKVIPGQKVETPEPVGPKDLPVANTNSDNTNEGKYWDEWLSDPGILHGVTGTGNGPIIGM